MAPQMLERIAEITAREEQIAQIVASVSAEFPWVRDLSLDDFLSMLQELGPAVAFWQKTKDATDLEEILADWEATVEARKNREFMANLRRDDLEYVPWE
jgi:hypothetical protein